MVLTSNEPFVIRLQTVRETTGKKIWLPSVVALSMTSQIHVRSYVLTSETEGKRVGVESRL